MTSILIETRPVTTSRESKRNAAELRMMRRRARTLKVASVAFAATFVLLVVTTGILGNAPLLLAALAVAAVVVYAFEGANNLVERAQARYCSTLSDQR